MQPWRVPFPSRHWDVVLAVCFAATCAWVSSRAFLGPVLAIPGRGDLPVDGAHEHFIYAQIIGWLLRGEGLVRTDNVWFPVGYPFLLWHQNILDALVATPFLEAFGSIRGLSIFSAFVLLSNGLAGAWLARKTVGPGWATLAGAVVLGCSPYALGELEFGRATQAWLAPSAIAVGLAWDAGQSWRRAVAAGIALAVTGYQFWPYGPFTALIITAVVFGRSGLAPSLRTLGIIAAVSALLTVPFIYYVSGLWAEMPGTQLKAPRFQGRADLLGGLPWRTPHGDCLYLPHLLLLAVPLSIAFGASRRAALVLSLAVIALITLSLGSSIRIGHTSYLLPFAALQKLPGFSRFWWPYRALGPVTVGLVPLVALLFSRMGRKTLVSGLIALALCVAQTWRAPGPVQAAPAPPLGRWHQMLPPGAVLFVPVLDPMLGKKIVFQQPLHGRPLVNGISMWERYMWSPGYTQLFEEQPLLSALLRIEQGQQVTGDPAWAAPLAAKGVVAILADRGLPTSWDPRQRAEAELLRTVVGEPECLDREPYCFWRLKQDGTAPASATSAAGEPSR